jgi:dTDP-4-amino-4,6-dideoxygalactose transaminase
MNSLEAVIGLGIVDRLAEFVAKRHQNMEKLDKLFGKNCFLPKPDRYVVPHAYPLIMKTKEDRGRFLKLFPEKFNIEARQIFYSIPTQSQAYAFLNEKTGAYPVAEDIGNRGLYVPCHQNLTDQDLSKIADSIKPFMIF